MGDHSINRFRSSLLRCLSNLRFLDRFYSEFMSSSHEVKAAFANTNMERQKAMLNASLYQLTSFYEKSDEDAKAHIEELGAIHGKHGLNIPAHLYDLWLESLLVAVSACDPDYDRSLEKTWREVLTQGIEVMKSASHNIPHSAGYGKIENLALENEVDIGEIHKVIRQLNQLSKEAAHNSNVEKDLEAMAFQFGQYRAYLYASELLVAALGKKTVL